MVRRKNLCSSVRSVGDKIIIRGGRNDLSVGKDITDPLYLPLKIRLSERRRSLFVLPSVRILSKISCNFAYYSGMLDVLHLV